MATTSLTEQLQRLSMGDREIADVVLREVLPKLHELAVNALRRERYAPSISPSDLIQEVWLKNLGRGGWQIKNRGHFYSIAARAMRQTLIGVARRRLAGRRGNGHAPISLEQVPTRQQPSVPSAEQVVQIAILIDELERRHPEIAQIVDLHYIAGFSQEEIAKDCRLTLRQVRHRWEKGQDWLKDRMTEEGAK